MKTVSEVSRLTGVSVRTLHHYDQIGLLHPAAVTEAGYRLYDDAALRKLQSILLLRELEFPLREIRTILEQPGFDPSAALQEQIHLLELRREHTDRVLTLARNLMKKGESFMDFTAFDRTELDAFAAEARARWENTEAWKESQTHSAEENASSADGLMAVFARFGPLTDGAPDSPEAQALAAELQQYITDHFYRCTPEIFRGLGEMYRTDERFRENIDRAAHPGTAEFAAEAIRIFTE